MTLKPTDSKNFLYLYGNNSIRNQHFLIGGAENENSTPIEIQTQTLAKNSGQRPINQRLTHKKIKVKGEIAVQNLDLLEIDLLIQKLNKIYSKQYRMLRIMPSFLEICDSSTPNVWSLGGDGQNLNQDLSDYEFNDKSLTFDINVNSSSNNFTALTANLGSPLDLSDLLDKGSLDFWLEIPDIYFVTSIDFLIGSDSSNFWSYNFTTNYEERKLENGVNYFSCPFSKKTLAPCFVEAMIETGTPNFASTNYIQVKINYSGTAIDIKKCRFGEFFAVNESKTMNYICYRENEIAYTKNWDYSRRVRKYEVNLINYLGYGQATHLKLLAKQEDIATLSNTQLVNFDGTFEPAPILKLALNSTTNLNNLTIKNLNNSEITQFTNSWRQGDNVILDKKAEFDMSGNQLVRKNGLAQDFEGKIPSFELGINRINLLITQSSANLISQTGNNQELPFKISQSLFKDFSQSFFNPVAGTLSKISLKVRGKGAITCRILASSLSSDTTLAASNQVLDSLASSKILDFPFSLVLSANTTYRIVITGAFVSIGGGNSSEYYLGVSNQNLYSNGELRDRVSNSSTWNAINNTDAYFEATVEPTPFTDIDFSIEHLPFYS
jgi:hypothetical protein